MVAERKRKLAVKPDVAAAIDYKISTLLTRLLPGSAANSMIFALRLRKQVEHPDSIRWRSAILSAHLCHVLARCYHG